MARRKKRIVQSIPGHWTTSELSSLLGVTPAAIAAQVSRGKLRPLDRRPGQEYLFAAEEISRYLAREPTTGRPPNYRVCGTALPI